MSDAYRKQTEELFSIIANPTVWTPSRQIVKNVFVGFPTYAFTFEQVFLIARAVGAMVDCPQNEGHIQDALNFFAKRKVLRSYKKQGKRLYEVAY